MCLVIDTDRHPTVDPIEIESDMTVWKVIKKDRHLFRSGSMSQYRHFNYYPGYRYETALVVDTIGRNMRVVYEGYHSYIERGRAAIACSEACMIGGGSRYVVKRFTIPAGSKVFYGNSGDIVSNNIIFH